MGKPYGHIFHFVDAGCIVGEMKCATCNQPIFNHAHDWVEYRKNFRGADGWPDWKYVIHHRRCYPDQSGWLKVEADRSKKMQRNLLIRAALDKVCADFGITPDGLVELIEAKQ